MKILITGSSGNIGSSLTKYLQNNTDYTIHGLDRIKSNVNLLDVFYDCDITDQCNLM